MTNPHKYFYDLYSRELVKWEAKVVKLRKICTPVPYTTDLSTEENNELLQLIIDANRSPFAEGSRGEELMNHKRQYKAWVEWRERRIEQYAAIEKASDEAITIEVFIIDQMRRDRDFHEKHINDK